MYFTDSNRLKTFSFKQIKKYSLKSSFKNFPVFEIVLNNEDIIRFNCLDKVSSDLDSFIIKLNKYQRRSHR